MEVNSDASIIPGSFYFVFNSRFLSKSPMEQLGAAAVKDGGGEEESSRHLLVGDRVETSVSPRQRSCSIWNCARPAKLSLSAVSWHGLGSIGRLGEQH